MSITDTIRAECARVASLAAHVRIELDAIASYAASLPEPVPSAAGPLARGVAEREQQAAFWLTLDAINFGSGWFPTLRKRSEPTGYRTIASGVRRRFQSAGPWSAAELGELGREELAQVLDQEPEHELIGLFAASLQDLGDRLQEGYGGCFSALVDEAGVSAVALVQRLAGWRCFADSSEYRGRTVPFLKRAQITAADLQRAGVAEFQDLGALTMFADNLVPHVLRCDGVLSFDDELIARIERGELIEHGAADEVEIRACAVHAVELLVAAAPFATTAAAVDQHLWNRGQAPEYKTRPRHRSRTTAY